MATEDRGFRELEHTADWELEVWGPDMATLLEQAARGMYRLMGVVTAAGPRRTRRLQLRAEDREELMVDFLNELLFLVDSGDGAAVDFALELEADGLSASVELAPVVDRTKEIKAVTYHRIDVRQDEGGLTTRVVFDV